MSFVFRFLSHLPLSLLHNLGALIGWLVYLASPTYRCHFLQNWRCAALDGSFTVAVAEAGKTICELPKLWCGRHATSFVVKISNWSLVEDAHQAGRGILFFTPHLGCYEISAQYVANFFPITVMYRKPHKAWLAPLMEAGRGALLKLAPADMSGVRAIMKALKQGEAAGILPDQVPGNGEGAWADFFGRPAYTMTLAPRLAQMDVTVIFAFAERLPYGAGYHLQFFSPVNDVTTPDGMNKEIERIIALCPEQYLWGYNRYKTPSGAPLP